MSEAISLLSPYASMTCTGTTLRYITLHYISNKTSVSYIPNASRTSYIIVNSSNTTEFSGTFLRSLTLRYVVNSFMKTTEQFVLSYCCVCSLLNCHENLSESFYLDHCLTDNQEIHHFYYILNMKSLTGKWYV
jgi:hypothetical protein